MDLQLFGMHLVMLGLMGDPILSFSHKILHKVAGKRRHEMATCPPPPKSGNCYGICTVYCLVHHCGSNDIGKIKLFELCEIMEKSLDALS